MPDYNFLKRIFKEKLIREGHQYDHIFDWILIPLKLKDTALSNRIPLNRITKKDQMEPSMANLDSNLKEDYEYWEDVTANQLEVKKEDKPKK